MVRPRPAGRPLAASDAQRKTVLKLRRARRAPRAIAEETNLGFSTVRTIVDQSDGRDRTTMKDSQGRPSLCLRKFLNFTPTSLAHGSQSRQRDSRTIAHV
jgi:hypothetical protein